MVKDEVKYSAIEIRIALKGNAYLGNKKYKKESTWIWKEYIAFTEIWLCVSKGKQNE